MSDGRALRQRNPLELAGSTAREWGRRYRKTAARRADDRSKVPKRSVGDEGSDFEWIVGTWNRSGFPTRFDFLALRGPRPVLEDVAVSK